ncbi:hypothetical protein RFI_03659 [Reticulomyxa filosa]|uniref:PAC1-like LisH-like dimerisation domain-containing protein n=1 Tax=Reticulomyxa filosa TaxID=46433 RepID=X6P741_RETFI|nr:hypothetical protein RFI_03659 [Reticulomyxa filosa]|eukprot:ETO33447.1 hypothetical protein RFI_03659 [Reticulomyxa filosa]
MLFLTENFCLIIKINIHKRNEAVLEYLNDNGYSKSVEAFKEESKSELPTQSTRALEKKWTAIIALTKKVHELQSQLDSKENELKQALPFQYGHALANKVEFGDSLPNEVKFQMTGHRRPINKVIFHPVNFFSSNFRTHKKKNRTKNVCMRKISTLKKMGEKKEYNMDRERK